MNIGFALWSVFEHFPEASKAILLEDDLILSPDVLKYFKQLSPILDMDPGLSIVNAFGQNSFPTISGNLTTVLRVEMYPQYGWMTTRKWATESFTYWVKDGKGIDWDWWLFTEGPKRGLDAIVPEVSRTGHVGSIGAHVTGVEQFGFFSTRIMSSNSKAMVDLTNISPPEAYDYWLDGQIRSAIKIKLSSHPCIAFELFNRSESDPFVMYLGVSSRADSENGFLLLQACLGADERDVKELYNGVMRLNVSPYETVKREVLPSKKVLYLVGCPLSKYCKYSKEFIDWQIPLNSVAEVARDVANARRYQELSDTIRYRRSKESQKLAY